MGVVVSIFLVKKSTFFVQGFSFVAQYNLVFFAAFGQINTSGLWMEKLDFLTEKIESDKVQ